MGEVWTFYSYKGGVGRSLALANIAWLLAANGRRVLAVDWDLEAPGLHRFFRPFLDEDRLAHRTGVLDALTDFRRVVAEHAWTRQDVEELAEHHADIGSRALRIDWPHFPGRGTLDLLCAGRADEAQYTEMLNSLDWNAFYADGHGPAFVSALGRALRRGYDHVLVDSRTGLGDSAGIGTIELPDSLVVCFTLSDQGIEGAASVARAVLAARRAGGRPLRVLPVPMRIDGSEHERHRLGHALARSRFAGLPEGMDARSRDEYWARIQFPYRPFYAFEEILAVFGDQPGDPQALLAACERLTAVLTSGAVHRLPHVAEPERRRYLQSALRRAGSGARLTIVAAPADLAWARWVEAVLLAGGAQVEVCGPDAEAEAVLQGRPVVLLSEALLRSVAGQKPVGLPGAVCVRIGAVAPEGAPEDVVDLVHLEEAPATRQLLQALLPERGDESVPPVSAPFPGTGPEVRQVPSRNPRFRGRDSELTELARLLTEHQVVAVTGAPGAGATELVREFVHRHRPGPRIVWWASAAEDGALRGALAELRRRVPQLHTAGAATEVLLIVDGVVRPDQVLAAVSAVGARLVLTGRWEALARLPADVPLLTLGPLPAEDALALLPTVDDGARELVRLLAGDARCTDLCGRLLAATALDAARLLAELRGAGRAAQLTAVVGLALAELARRSPAALRVLRLCAAAGGAPLPEDLLRDDELMQELEELQPDTMGWSSFPTLCRILDDLGLVRWEEGEALLCCDAAVGAAVLARTEQAELQECRHRVHRLLTAHYRRLDADMDSDGSWRFLDRLWSHLLPSGADRCDDPGVRSLLVDRVRYLWRRGEPGAAEELARLLLRRWAARPLDEDWRTLRLRTELGNAVRAQGRYAESLAIDAATLAEQSRRFGPDHVHTLLTAGGLAAGLRATGRYPEALERDQASLEALVRQVGRGHEQTMRMLNNLAVDHSLLGEFAQAHRLFQEVLDWRSVNLPAGHALRLQSLGSLARAVRDLGRPHEARSRLLAVHDSLVAAYGPEHRLSLWAACELAQSLRACGEPGQGLALAQRSLRTAVGGRPPTDSADCRLALAVAACRWSVGDATGALEAAEGAVDALTEQLGADHPDVLLARDGLFVFLGARGRPGDLARARDGSGRNAEQLERRLGWANPRTALAWSNHALLRAGAGEPAPALDRLAACAEALADRLGPDHPDGLLAAANQSALLERTGHRLEAAALRGRILPRLERLLGAKHPEVLAVRQGACVHRVLELQPW